MSEARRKRKQMQKEQHAFVNAMPERMMLVPQPELPALPGVPIRVWRSRHFLAQLFNEANPFYPEGVMRLSICRTKMLLKGADARHSFKDEITWDEIAQIKRECGFGDVYGVEVYPRDKDLVNVANIRHIWLLAKPLPLGWFNLKREGTSHE